MADFLLQLPPVQQRRPRNYQFNANLLNYTDEELRARYRFGSESIQFITNLIETDLRRKTNRSHALRPIDQVLIALRFYASGNFLQVIGDTEVHRFTSSPWRLPTAICEAEHVHKVANNCSRHQRKQERFLPKETVPGNNWLHRWDADSHYCS